MELQSDWIGTDSNDLMILIVVFGFTSRYIDTIVGLIGTSSLPDDGIAMDVDGPRRRVDGHLMMFEQERERERERK